MAGLIFVVGLFLVAIVGGQLRMGVTAPIDGQSFLNRLMLVDRPSLGHLLLALPIIAGVAIAGFRRGVLQMPSMAVWVPLTALFFWLAIGVPLSPTRYEAILDFARWVTAFAALMGCCFLLGRNSGPRVAAWALFAGVAVVGFVGIAEFAEASKSAGNWRIFAGWHNPNAVAGILMIGLPLGMGLFAGAEERLEKLLLGFGMAAILCALWFTGSKGGLGAAAVGIVSWLILCAAKKGVPSGWWNGLAAAIVGGSVLIAVLGFGASRLGTSSFAGRLGEGGAAEQSVGFRTALWKDSLKVVMEKPVTGQGAGAYSIAVRKSGTTLGSELAHQTYLQMAAEYGVVGVLIAVALVFVWLVAVLRKHPSEPPDKTILRYAVVAAVLAIGANGLVESNLSFFGIRVALFALLGLGLNLSVDGLVPERIPVGLRAVVATLLAAGAGYTFIAAVGADQKVSAALAAIQENRPGEAQRLFISARKFAPADPQPTFQFAKLAVAMNDWKMAADLAQEAAMRSPDASAFALVAEAQASLGNSEASMHAIDKAVAAEPVDPYWLTKKFHLLRAMGRYEEAARAARSAIEVEEALDNRPNALPWLVTTDTIAARQWLLQRATSSGERQQLLKGLFERLAKYAERSAPEIARVSQYNVIAETKVKLGKDATDEAIAKELNVTVQELYEFRSATEQFVLVGESVSLARQKQELLFEVGGELERLYRSEGNTSSADAVRERLEGIEEAGALR